MTCRLKSNRVISVAGEPVSRIAGMGKRNKRQRGPLTPKNKSAMAPAPIREPVQLFGFGGGEGGGAIPNYDDAVCMCTEVVASDLAGVTSNGVQASVGQFIVRAKEESSKDELFGPFATMEEALEFAREKFGAERW